MNDYSNRQVEFPNRIQLIKVPGTEDIFDFVWVPGRITNEGGIADEAFFKSVDDDIKAKLPITSKATQAEAEEGTNNTKYMTPLMNVQAINKFSKIKYNSIICSTTGRTTINFEDYLSDDVLKVELMINIDFDDSTNIKISGNGINDVARSSDRDTTIAIESTNQTANLTISIYPKQHKFQIIGTGNYPTSSSQDINLSYSYNTLSDIVLGKMNGASYANYDEPVSVIQYLK